MDLVWYDYLAMIAGIATVYFAFVTGEALIVILAVVGIAFGIDDAHGRSTTHSHRTTEAQFVHQGFPRPTRISGGNVFWTVAGCQLKFKLKQSEGKPSALVVHSNGTTTVLSLSQLSGLLSNPVCQ